MARTAKIVVTVTSLSEVSDDIDNNEIAEKLGAAYKNMLGAVNIPADFIEVEVDILPEDKPKLQVVDRWAGPS